MTEDSHKTITIKKAVDMEVLGDNILDIAEFAVEKHEFQSGAPLSDDVREAALQSARDALWEMVDKLKLRRKQILQALFEKADAAVEGVVEGSES